jgi:hypothetical protein
MKEQLDTIYRVEDSLGCYVRNEKRQSVRNVHPYLGWKQSTRDCLENKPEAMSYQPARESGGKGHRL